MNHITVNLQNAEKPRTPPSKHSKLVLTKSSASLSSSFLHLATLTFARRSRSAWGGAAARRVRRRHGNHAILGPRER